MARLKTSIQLKTGLTPGLRQSLSILHMNAFELRDEIDRVLEENPFLEEKSRPEFDHSFEVTSNTPGQDVQGLLENLPGLTQTLQGRLSEQITLLEIGADTRQLLNSLVSLLDEQGFIGKNIEETSVLFSASRRNVREAIKILRRLDPPYIGAENSWQCLSWQAEELYANDVILHDILAILQSARASITRLNYVILKEMAVSLCLDEKTIRQKLAKIKKLNPFPAQNFAGSLNRPVYPDIVYLESNTGIEVSVQDQLLPELKLNRKLFDQMGKAPRADKEQVRTWKQKYHTARSIVRSISYRHTTIEKLAHILLYYQEDFFLKGTNHLRPLNMSDVASDLKLHVSTISRLVADKYCQCKWGVFKLKIFFPRRIKSHGKSELGTEDLRKAILKIIGEEDMTKPLTDENMAELLNERGFDIKRRTVNKYRKLLHIPSAGHRKVDTKKPKGN